MKSFFLSLIFLVLSLPAFAQTAPVVSATVAPGAIITLAWDHPVNEPNTDGFILCQPNAVFFKEVLNETLRTVTFNAPLLAGVYKYNMQSYVFTPRSGSVDTDANADGLSDWAKSFSPPSNDVTITVVVPIIVPPAPTNLRIQ